MQRRQPRYSCTVIIPLNKHSVLELRTSATHALEILSGETVLPSEQTKVIDGDGNPLTKQDLLRLRDNDQ